MTNQTFQTICQVFILVGAIIAALGWYGSYIYGKKVEMEKEARQAMVGHLQPEHKLIFSSKDHIYPLLELGDSGTIFKYAGPQGSPLFKFAGDNEIKVEVEGGQVQLSTKIRDYKEFI